MFNKLNEDSNSCSEFNTDTESESESESELDLDIDIDMKKLDKYMKKTKRNNNYDSDNSEYYDNEGVNDGINDGMNDDMNDDSNIDTISMCSSYSIEKYEEVELIAKK